MAHKLRCYLCSEIHKARADKFPVPVLGTDKRESFKGGKDG